MAEALAQPLRSFLAHHQVFRLVPQLFLCLRCTAGYCVAMNELSKSLDEPRGVFEEHLLFNLVYCSQVSPGIEQAKVHQSMLKMMALSVTALVSVAFSVNGYAESSTSTMNVSVSVEYSCAIESSLVKAP